MTTHYRKKLVAVIALSFLSFTSPLLLIRSAGAESVSAAKASPKEIASLIEKLKSNDEKGLDGAVEKLGKIGEPAIPALINSLQDNNWLVRRNAAEVLQIIGDRAAPALLQALKDSDVNVNRRVTVLLEKIIRCLSPELSLSTPKSQAKTAVPKLTRLLEDSDADVRKSAAYVLGFIGAEAKTAMPKLTALLKNKNSDAGVRANTAYALGNIALEAKTALPDVVLLLTDLLKDPDADVLIATGYALANIGVEAKTAAPKLTDLLKNPNPNVRKSAEFAFSQIGAEAKSVVPNLTLLLRDPNNASVRKSALKALGSIGAEAKTALDDVVLLFGHPDADVRKSAAIALRRIGSEAKTDLSKVVSLLEDPDEGVCDYAGYALEKIGTEAKTAVPELIRLLQNSKVTKVRGRAAEALGYIGADAKTAVPELIRLFEDKNSDAGVRSKAVLTLGKIGAESKTAVPGLIRLLEDKNSDAGVRSKAVFTLGKIGAEAKTAVPTLIRLLEDKNSDAGVRSEAVLTLGKIGAEAKAAMPQLIPLLKDSDASVRSGAAYALQSIALSLLEKAKTLTSTELNQAVSNLESALKIMAEPKADFSESTIASLRAYFNILKTEQNDRLFITSILQNPCILGPGIYLFLLFGTFAIRPLWVLKFYEILKGFGCIKIPFFGTEVSLSLGNFIFLKYHHKVLDAWVTAHIPATRNEFQKRETVSDRKIFVPIPVILDNNTIATLKGKDLQPTFAQKRGCLLIWEEGGAGKTSLACQIGQWAMSDNPEERICTHLMLPVLIEDELKLAEGKQPLIEVIRGQLQDLTDTNEPISEELLKQLLIERRILVIVDHLSEMSEQTRTAIKPEMPDFSVNALLVTSRLEEPLGRVTKTAIKPLRIAGNRLSSFMESYLSQRQKRDLFSDEEFFDSCKQLSIIVGDRNITVLLAKLYADQLIAKKEGTTDDNLPHNIAELMLHYLNQVNRSITENKSSDSTVHKDAKIIAWECLKPTYRPAGASHQNAIDALGGENTESRIKYLEDKLRIIQTKGVAHDQIHFALDPVAEYLAALHLLDINGKDESKWQDFLNAADSQNSPEAIAGFLLALKDCYLDRIPGANDTDFLPKEIAARYNVSIAVPPQSP